MSLSNEQRAHDLAIASLPYMKELVEQEIRSGNELNFDIYFDIYFEYKKMYDLILDAVNRDFT